PKGSLLIIDAPFTAEAQRAARNIERVSLQEAAKLNAYDLARYSKVVISSKALDVVLARVNGGTN
ncbi:MAG TPA: 50S ribosomal protein L4, partial [Opitutaceae bacterium]|nr:50S ribosomal protein L4 [Opitutaceae bacterium]